MLNILWHVKATLPIMKEIFRRQNPGHFLLSFTLRPYFVSLLGAVREPWWMNQE
jgi:hypothetical protein